MPTYLLRLVADSSVRLSEKPYIETTVFPFTLQLKGEFIVTVFDNEVGIGSIVVPKGLVINAQIDSDDLESAIGHAQGAATYVLSMLSCICNASVGQPRPLWGYDATPGLSKRDVVIFGYDYSLQLKTRPLQQANWSALLEAKFNGFMLREELAADLKYRMQRAVLAFRRGLADTEDMLDEFLVHWSTLETLDVVYRKVFNHKEEYYYSKCGNCKNEFKYCPICNNTGVFRKPQRHTGIEAVFKNLQQPGKYKELRDLRNGISHGYKGLQECVDTAADNIELVRKAVLTTILEILGLDEGVQASVLKEKGFKNKYLPHVRVYGKGTFEPGDPRRYDTHPQLYAERTDLEVQTTDIRVIVRPKWLFKHADCQLTDIVAEIRAEEGAGLVITDDITFLQDEPNPHSEACG